MKPKPDGDPRSYRDLVAALFRTLPGIWIDGDSISQIGGKGWSTRVSDCRTQLGLMIENRRQRERDGSTLSQYRYLPIEYQIK